MVAPRRVGLRGTTKYAKGRVVEGTRRTRVVEVRRRGEGGWTRMRRAGVWLVGSWRKSWGVRKKGWDR
ncbi:MAG: hypothetical protein ACI9TH_004129 [Kiritimatiellia bacterium]|jgi:hypothetical protein